MNSHENGKRAGKQNLIHIQNEKEQDKVENINNHLILTRPASIIINYYHNL